MSEIIFWTGSSNVHNIPIVPTIYIHSSDTVYMYQNSKLLAYSETTKQMDQILNFQVPAEGLNLVISLHTQY